MRNNRFEFELEQYRQCYESLRQHDRFIWQIPSLIILVCGALAVAAFAYVLEKCPRAAGAILLMAALISFALSLAILKHRYFAKVEQGTLTQIEGKYGKLIQRMTNPYEQLKKSRHDENLEHFWYHENFTFLPTKCEWHKWIRSAHVWLICVSFAITVILLVLAVICFLRPSLLR